MPLCQSGNHFGKVTEDNNWWYCTRTWQERLHATLLSNCMQTVIYIRGGSRGGGEGGAWGAHVPPLGLSKHETQRFITRLAHYLLQPSTDHTNYCFMFCKLKSAATVLWQCFKIQRLILKRKGSKKWPYDESPELHSSCHKCWVVMVVSDGLRSTLRWSKFLIFPWETCSHLP